jgi:hypothetical protein
VVNTDQTSPVMTQPAVEPPIAGGLTASVLQQAPVPLSTASEHEHVELANGTAPSESSHDPIAERLKLVEQRFVGGCYFNYLLVTISRPLTIYCAN